MTTTPSVEAVHTAGRVADAIDRVTSMLARRQATSGKPTGRESTRGLLTYGSLRSGHSGSAPTEIQQLSPWNLCSPGAALQQAATDVHDTLGTRTSGETVILVFATPVWRLLIATTNSALPAVSDGELSGCAQQQIWRFLSAKLFAQPQANEETSCSVLRAWHVAAQAADDEATSRFLSTVLGLSQMHSRGG